MSQNAATMGQTGAGQTGTAQERRGKVVQVIGPVIDIEFPGDLPEIYNAVRVVSDGSDGSEKIDVVAEVEQHLGENRVRAVAMKPTDGMTRGMTVIDTGSAITVPVGPETLGRVLNVLGEPVDFPLHTKIDHLPRRLHLLQHVCLPWLASDEHFANNKVKGQRSSACLVGTKIRYSPHGQLHSAGS